MVKKYKLNSVKQVSMPTLKNGYCKRRLKYLSNCFSVQPLPPFNFRMKKISLFKSLSTAKLKDFMVVKKESKNVLRKVTEYVLVYCFSWLTEH